MEETPVKTSFDSLEEALQSPLQVQELSLYSKHGERHLVDRIGELCNLESLRISFMDLDRLPESIGKLTKLTNLDLHYNYRLAGLPESIGALKSLKKLNLSECRFTHLPEAISKLEKLAILLLDKNPLTTLPHGLQKLRSLKQLSLNKSKYLDWPQSLPIVCAIASLEELLLENNSITTIPVQIGQLRQLKTLRLSDNQIQQLPAEIGQLLNLETLLLDDNNLESIPESIGQLVQIKALQLSRNKLKTIPPSVCSLPKLANLQIWDNYLQEIPIEITQLLNIHHLDLSGNQIKMLPDELCGMHWLQHLSLKHNRLKALPDRFFTFAPIREVDLSENRLQVLPLPSHSPEHITRLNLSKNPDLDWEDTFTKLTHFSSLHKVELDRNKLRNLPEAITHLTQVQELDISENPELDFNDTLEKISRMPNLSQVWCNKAPLDQVPVNLVLVKAETDIHLDFSPRLRVYKVEEKRKQLIRQGFSVDERKLLLLLHVNDLAQATRLFQDAFTIAHVAPWLDAKDKNLVMNLLSLLEAVLPDPLIGKETLAGSVFLVAGRLPGFTQELIRQRLKEHNVRLTQSPAEASHVLIGLGKATLAKEALEKGATPVLDAHVKNWLITQDTPFLLEVNEEQAELTANVIALLRSEDANVEIGLQMLEGGGVSRQMVSAVLALHLWHSSASTRKLAAKLFQKHASPDLQAHVKAIWIKDFRKLKMWRKHQQILLLENLLNHAAIDKTLAMELIWRSARKGAALVVKYGAESLPDALKEMRFRGILLLENLNGYISPQFFVRMAEVARTHELPPLEILDLSNSGLTTLPEEIKLLSDLKGLYLSKVKFPAAFRKELQTWLPQTDIQFKRYRR